MKSKNEPDEDFGFNGGGYRWNRKKLIVVGTVSISKAHTMTARPSVGTLTSGIRGLDLNRVASTGRRHTMTIISLAIIILVILDICLIREMDKMEDHLQVTLRATSRLCDAFKKHIQEEAHNDKRTSD